MRPAYRYSVIVAVLLVLAALAAWSLRPAPPEDEVPPAPPGALPDPRRPPRVRAPARPDPAAIPGALDRIEAVEAEQLGPARAAERRRQREQLIRERTGAERAPEAPDR